MDLMWLSISGVIIGILIFALKVSLGCGLAGLSPREVLAIAASYLVMSLIMGMATDLLAENALMAALNTGAAMHLMLAMLMIALGVMTARSWNSHHHDMSRKTFWILSMPCPACLAASFISCSFLAGQAEMDSWKIGAIVGIIFFASIAIFSRALGRIRRAPSVMGHAMIFLGLFYILSMLLIPAFLSFQKISLAPMNLPLMDMAYSYLFIAAIVALGFLSRRRGAYI